MGRKRYNIMAVILIVTVYCNASPLIKGDDLLEFTLKKKVSEAVKGNMEGILKVYIDFGFLKEVLPLIRKMDKKYSILKYALSSSKIKMIGSLLAKIEEMIASDIDPYYQTYLLQDLGVAYSRIGEREKANKIFSQIYRKVKKEEDLYEQSMNLIGSNGLCDSLIEARFPVDAEKLLRETEMTMAKLNDQFELLDVTFNIAFQYLKLNKKKEILKIIKKVEEIDLKRDASDLLIPTIVYDLGEILVQLKESGKAKDFFLKAFHISKLIDDEKTLVRLYSDKFLITPRTNLTFETIAKIKEVVEILEKSLMFPHSQDEQDRLRRVRRMNRSIIRFFVQVGLNDKALQLARIIDNKLAKPEYLDYYYFSIGARTLLTSGFTSQIRGTINKIKNKSLKIDLLLQMAEIGREKTGKDKIITVMKEVDELFYGINDIHIKAEKAYEIALSWLDSGYPDRAMKMLAFETDPQKKALTIFMIAQYYVLNSKFSSARRLILTVNEPFKSLITSKIAAKMMCNNKKIEAVWLFKSAIVSLVEKNLLEFLPGVFLDYLTSKKYKVVRTENKEVYVD